MKFSMRLLYGALALLLAIGVPCAAIAQAPPTTSDDSGCGALADENQYQICTVNVTVAGGKVSVVPTQLYVDDQFFRINRRIVWVLQTSGYVFQSGSISLKPGGNANIGEFELKDDTHLRAHLRHWVFNLCQSYGITVYDKSGTPVSWDPVIANSHGFNLAATGC